MLAFATLTLRMLLPAALTIFMGVLISFVAVNLVLGCNTWDQTLWGENHSCVSFRDLLPRSQ